MYEFWIEEISFLPCITDILMLQGMGMGGGMMDGGGMMGPGGNMGPPGNNMVSTATHSSFFKSSS